MIYNFIFNQNKIVQNYFIKYTIYYTIQINALANQPTICKYRSFYFSNIINKLFNFFMFYSINYYNNNKYNKIIKMIRDCE